MEKLFEEKKKLFEDNFCYLKKMLNEENFIVIWR